MARIITRYPAMDRAVDAKARLQTLHQTVPRPTRATLENNKKEVESRHELGIMSSMLENFEKHPGVAKASHYGEPTLVDPEPVTRNGECGGDDDGGRARWRGTRAADDNEASHAEWRPRIGAAPAAEPREPPESATAQTLPAATADVKAVSRIRTN